MTNIEVFLKFLFLIRFFKCILADSEDVYYVGEFTDDITDCEGFENNVFKCNDLTIGFIKGEEDGETGLGLSGQLDILAEIKDGYTICLKVWKLTDLGKEFMYTVSGNLCASLGDEDTPWWPLIKSLNTTKCPISENVYPVEEMVLTLGFAKDVLRHELCGYYVIELSILGDLEETLSCHMVPAQILEKVRE
ncbi:unnamed protein product, partial [Brenthis ino]